MFRLHNDQSIFQCSLRLSFVQTVIVGNMLRDFYKPHVLCSVYQATYKKYIKPLSSYSILNLFL